MSNTKSKTKLNLILAAQSTKKYSSQTLTDLIQSTFRGKYSDMSVKASTTSSRHYGTFNRHKRNCKSRITLQQISSRGYKPQNKIGHRPWGSVVAAVARNPRNIDITEIIDERSNPASVNYNVINMWKYMKVNTAVKLMSQTHWKFEKININCINCIIVYEQK
jgi:hypothetical protein